MKWLLSGLFALILAVAPAIAQDRVMPGRYNAALPTLVEGQFGPLQVDINGRPITVILPGTPSASTDYHAEDAAHVSGDVGDFILCVRTANATPEAANADGDYTYLACNENGALKSLPVDRLGVPLDFTGYTSEMAILTATSGLVNNSSAVATLSGSASKTTYITGFECSAGGATAAAFVSVVVSGTISGSMTYRIAATNGSTFVPAPMPLVVEYPVPIPASATNTSIVVTMGATGAGGTNAVCNSHGFRL